MGRWRSSLLVPLAAVSGLGVFLLSCGEDGQTGACNGTEPGGYYRLEMLNYLQDTLDIRVNGRFVGSVQAAVLKQDPNNPSAVTPGHSFLGEFPVCDHTVIDYAGTNIGSSKVCGTAKLVDPACVQAWESTNYCWLSIIDVDATGNPPQGSDIIPPQSPSCTSIPACQGGFTFNQNSC